MTDRFLKTVRRVKLKSRMLEICKSGSVRGIEVFSHGLNIVTLRKPKGRRNREYKINLKEKTILCLLDSQRLTAVSAVLSNKKRKIKDKSKKIKVKR